MRSILNTIVNTCRSVPIHDRAEGAEPRRQARRRAEGEQGGVRGGSPPPVRIFDFFMPQNSIFLARKRDITRACASSLGSYSAIHIQHTHAHEHSVPYKCLSQTRNVLIFESLCNPPPTYLVVPLMDLGLLSVKANTPLQHPPHGSWV